MTISATMSDTGAMASLDEVLAAIDRRMLEVIEARVPGDALVRLAEARAWLTNPDQPHGGTSANG